jgi:hypothetical protein
LAELQCNLWAFPAISTPFAEASAQNPTARQEKLVMEENLPELGGKVAEYR